jgi:hypothetical protein
MKKILLTTLFLFPLLSFASSIPAFPMAFWGSASIDGQSAPVGTVVKTYYGSTLAGQVVVNELGVYGYTEPTKQKLIVSEGSGQITFKVQSSSINSGNETTGLTPITYTAFTSGITVNKNLAFVTVVVTPPTPPSGGGGGGGGGGSSTPPPVVITNKGDATGDGKVDFLDFNSLLVQWGKTGNTFTADFDKNGIVDFFDFNLLLINWSK